MFAASPKVTTHRVTIHRACPIVVHEPHPMRLCKRGTIRCRYGITPRARCAQQEGSGVSLKSLFRDRTQNRDRLSHPPLTIQQDWNGVVEQF